jgi:hypothetical protein
MTKQQGLRNLNGLAYASEAHAEAEVIILVEEETVKRMQARDSYRVTWDFDQECFNKDTKVSVGVFDMDGWSIWWMLSRGILRMNRVRSQSIAVESLYEAATISNNKQVENSVNKDGMEILGNQQLAVQTGGEATPADRCV